MRRITESTKKIISAEIPQWYTYSVGTEGVTRILAYDEAGDGAYVPWLAIIRDTNVWKRLPARMCVIEYAADGEEERLEPGRRQSAGD